jgi:hypothetical protein
LGQIRKKTSNWDQKQGATWQEHGKHAEKRPGG